MPVSSDSNASQPSGSSLSSAWSRSRDENEPLLNYRQICGVRSDDASPLKGDGPGLEDEHASEFREAPAREERQLGPFSAASLIVNRIVGTGIFATPSVILRSSGSVGLSLLLWLIGASVAVCGTAVYIELGTGLPRSGGEKVYLEYLYRRPRFLATCTYAMYAIFIGWQSASCSVFGEYALHVLYPKHPPSPTSSRVASLLCITFAFLLHSVRLSWGLRLQNTLGAFKLATLVSIALSGLAALAGAPGFKLETYPNNFEWETMWDGSLNGGANAFVTGLFTVIWCFVGYSNANYALSEVHDPVRTIKLAAPLSVLCITLLYLLVNVAYYVVIDKAEILGSGRIVAALYFGKVGGPRTERLLSVVLALSTLGNVLAVLFTHGRVIQQLGLEGILPFSSFFASNKPFNAPMSGLFVQWLVTAIVIVAVPAGDAYLFMLNMSTYPLSLINMFVSGGLLLLHVPMSGLQSRYDWNPPFRAYRPVIAFFFLSNVFLVFAPLVPPVASFRPYEHLPYWLHVLVASAISLVGVAYWYVQCVWLPRRGGYRLVQETVTQEDGKVRRVIKKVLS